MKQQKPQLLILIIRVIIKSKNWAPNQNIGMISKGSCDIEDLSNDAENSAFHHRNKLHFKMYYNRKQLV